MLRLPSSPGRGADRALHGPRPPRCLPRAGLPRRAGLLPWALLTLLALAGCGERPGTASDDPLVLVLGCPPDGPPPTQGLVARTVVQGRLSEAFPLVPAPGRPPGTYRVPGAPETGFLLELPDGWGMLSRMGVPHLRRGGEPTLVRVGRFHSLYVISGTRERPLGDVWGLRRVDPGQGLREALPLEVVPSEDGYTILRLRPADWTGGLALQGRFADGSLTETVLLQPKERGLPIYRVLQGEPLAPLQVVVVGASAPDTWVRVRVLGLPVEETQRRPLRDGVASFPGVSTTGEGVEVLPDERTPVGALRLPPGGWMREAEVRLRAPPGPDARALHLSLPADEEVRLVQLRGAAEASYGRVPFRVADGQIEVSLEPGAWRALVSTARGLRAAAFEVPAAGPVAAVPLGAPTAPVTVRGRVEQLQGGTVAWQRDEDGRWVLGQGFVAAIRSGGAYEAELPAGRYRLRLTAPDGTVDERRERTFEPGALVSLDLDPPQPAPPR